MKRILIGFFVLTGIMTARADEGMWLPSLLGKERIAHMQQLGLKLSAEEIYSINQASLKDAIVRFAGGCTAELISSEGLLITNHHCGYGAIQSHSSVEHDYLTYGFVAENRSAELPNPGLKVDFLVRMDDVTEMMNKGISGKMGKAEIDSVLSANRKRIVEEAVGGDSNLHAEVDPFYYGNQWYLFIFKVYKDVRLVMAPPSSVGKFGGDTDNWMWPRHTGDFSVFRIYAGKDNQPADYSTDNVPFHPAKHFTISTKGVKEGDFTFIYGYPGKTQRYLHSEGVRYIAEKGDPQKVALRTVRLDAMNKYQKEDPATRIKYASKNANVSNAWKKWQGEMLGLRRLHTVDKKVAAEKEFEKWAKGTQYEGITDTLGNLYRQQEPLQYAVDLYREGPLSIEIVKFALSATAGKANGNSFYKDYCKVIDSTSAVQLVGIWKESLPSVMLPKTDVSVGDVFAGSKLFTPEGFESLSDDELKNDPAVVFAAAVNEKYQEIAVENAHLSKKIDEAYKVYMAGLMKRGGLFFPDANLTLRVAYGRVQGYSPSDAVYYRPQSTIEGVMQKDNPEIYDYDVPEKLRELYAKKDYGRWESDGTVPVAFIATNHTTGGNSGSPVINADGELIGINFDRVWEGTMSDLEFDPLVCRNISIDIRYALFIMDKLMGAGYLLSEMDLN